MLKQGEKMLFFKYDFMWITFLLKQLK